MSGFLDEVKQRIDDLDDYQEGAAGDIYSVFVVHGDLSDDAMTAISNLVRQLAGGVHSFKASGLLLTKLARVA